jgi:hypothetical protein
MRTTLNIDDDTLARARKLAKRSRLSFRETVNRALRFGLDKLDPRPSRKAYRCTTYRMGFPPTLNLDKALQLAAFLEDEESIRKLTLKK